MVAPIDHVAEWFTEDFKLHDPSIGGFGFGHQGAQDVLRAQAEQVPSARIELLDMVEQGDKVAVLFAGMKESQPVNLSVAAIYRFEGDRIAEDWGVAARAKWP